MPKFVSVEEAGVKIKDGMLIATAGGNEKSSMAMVREIVRQGVKGLRLVFTPAGGINGDMLIGAGAVKSVDTGGLNFGEFGRAPNYGRVSKAGKIEAMDST
jgi:glutaconate CoA-transferase subunit A